MEDYFHTYCDKCHSEDGTQDLSLCSGCRHLRLPHLIQCVDTGLFDDHDLFFLFSFNELQERASSCRVCRFLRNMLHAHHNAFGTDELDMSNIFIYLWVTVGMLMWNSESAGGEILGPGAFHHSKVHKVGLTSDGYSDAIWDVWLINSSTGV